MPTGRPTHAEIHLCRLSSALDDFAEAVRGGSIQEAKAKLDRTIDAQVRLSVRGIVAANQ